MRTTIKVNNYTFFVYSNKTISLLQAMEKENIDVNYACRQGFCGACCTRLVEGKVSYFEEPIAFIPAGHILPCCCQVESDVVLKIGPITLL